VAGAASAVLRAKMKTKTLLLVIAVLVLSGRAAHGTSIWKETFEASEFDNVWDVETVDSGCTSDGDSAGPGGLYGSSTKCYLTITANDTTGDDSYVAEDWGSEEATVYVTMHVYLDAEDFGNNENVSILLNYTGASAPVMTLTIIQSANKLYLQPYYYDNGSLQTGTASEISLDTWYTVEMKYDRTGTEYQFKVDGSTVQTVTLTGALVRIQIIYIGQVASTSTNGNTLYLDAVEWDDAAYPDPEAAVGGQVILIIQASSVLLLWKLRRKESSDEIIQ
jgi:hypothetical protein